MIERATQQKEIDSEKVPLIPEMTSEAKKEKLLEQLHLSALAGVRLLDYLELSKQPSWEGFSNEERANGSLPEYTQDLFKEIIDRWKVLQTHTNDLLKVVHQELADAGKSQSDEEVIKRLFHLRGCERDPSGEVRLYRKGAYLVLYCETIEDYSSFYRGTKSPIAVHSGGTYHKELSFAWKERVELPADSTWDPESGEPPPIPYEEIILCEFKIPVLLVRPSNVRTVDTSIRHERQHLINEAFANLYHGKDPHETTSFKRLQDEVIAGISEGIQGKDLHRRLGKNRPDGYVRYIGGSTEEVAAHDQILEDIASALDDPFVASLFRPPLNRTILAFHLIHIPAGRLADRIRLLGKFFQNKLPVKPLETELHLRPFDLEKLQKNAPPETRDVCLEQANEVLYLYQMYQRAQRQIVSETNFDSQEISGSHERYCLEREKLMQMVRPWCSEGTIESILIDS